MGGDIKTHFSVRKSDFWLVIVIVSAGILCYINSLHNPFIWDQEVVIVGNPLIRSWKNLPLVFMTNVEGRRLTAIGFYRPLEVISYMTDYTFWKLNPFGYHCSSIFLHLCNSLLIFLLLKKLEIERRIAFVTSLIFTIHPVNTEVVTYSIRGDLLATLFSLLTIIFFIYFREGITRCRAVTTKSLKLSAENTIKRRIVFAILSLGMYLLALLAKEWAVVVPFIILAYTILFKRLTGQDERLLPGRKKIMEKQYKKNRSSNWLLWTLILIAVGYSAIRTGFITVSTTSPLSPIAYAPLWQRILTLPRILFTYLRLLIFPIHLHMEYLFVVRTLADAYVWLGVPALLTIVYRLYRYISSLPETENNFKKRILFFAIWFFIGLSPFYNIIIVLHATLTEHWVYFPGIGFLTFISLILFRSYDKLKKSFWKRVFVASFAALICFYVFGTIKRNYEWGDPMRLYQHDVKYEPNSFILHNNIGVLYFRQGDFEKAKEAFLRSIEVSPGHKYEVAYNNLGAIYENEGNLRLAEQLYKRSIELNRCELAYGNLARLYLKEGKINEAIYISTMGRLLYPLNPEVNYYLGVAYYHANRLEEAKAVFAELNKLHPGYKDIEVYLSNLELQQP